MYKQGVAIRVEKICRAKGADVPGERRHHRKPMIQLRDLTRFAPDRAQPFQQGAKRLF